MKNAVFWDVKIVSCINIPFSQIYSSYFTAPYTNSEIHHKFSSPGIVGISCRSTSLSWLPFLLTLSETHFLTANVRVTLTSTWWLRALNASCTPLALTSAGYVYRITHFVWPSLPLAFGPLHRQGIALDSFTPLPAPCPDCTYSWLDIDTPIHDQLVRVQHTYIQLLCCTSWPHRRCYHAPEQVWITWTQNKKQIPWLFVRTRTLPTERPAPVGEF
jgi:hypothetical protein